MYHLIALLCQVEDVSRTCVIHQYISIHIRATRNVAVEKGKAAKEECEEAGQVEARRLLKCIQEHSYSNSFIL